MTVRKRPAAAPRGMSLTRGGAAVQAANHRSTPDASITRDLRVGEAKPPTSVRSLAAAPGHLQSGHSPPRPDRHSASLPRRTAGATPLSRETPRMRMAARIGARHGGPAGRGAGHHRGGLEADISECFAMRGTGGRDLRVHANPERTIPTMMTTCTRCTRLRGPHRRWIGALQSAADRPMPRSHRTATRHVVPVTSRPPAHLPAPRSVPVPGHALVVQEVGAPLEPGFVRWPLLATLPLEAGRADPAVPALGPVSGRQRAAVGGHRSDRRDGASAGTGPCGRDHRAGRACVDRNAGSGPRHLGIGAARLAAATAPPRSVHGRCGRPVPNTYRHHGDARLTGFQPRPAGPAQTALLP